MKLLDDMNQTVWNILYDDLPESIRNQTAMVDAILESICTASHTLGYLVKHSLASGWLKYDESTSASVGAYFYMR